MRIPFLLSALVFAFISSVAVAWPARAAGDCSRIIALSPSLVELLFELELGENIVGASKYAAHPPEADKIQKIGGLLDPNIELIFTLRPTVVFMLAEQQEVAERLASLGVATHLVDHRSIEGIMSSVTEVSAYCGQTEEGRTLLRALEESSKEIERKVGERRSGEKVLIAIGVPERQAGLGSLFISGRDGFYTDLLKIAGGENVVASHTLSLPQISQEGLMALNPEIIIHIAEEGVSRSPEELRRAWKHLGRIDAVRNNRIYLISGGHAVVPGPRFPILLEEFFNILNGR